MRYLISYILALFCDACENNMDDTRIRPTQETFSKYIPFFLSDLPNENCAKAGRAAYLTAMNYISDENGTHHVQDSYFMSYHTTVVTSKDFYTALKKAREISGDIEEMLRKNDKSVEVFPYSVFYVFYEQYLTIWKDSLISLGLSLAAIFIVTLIITGIDIMSSAIILFTVFLILLNMGGLMWLWNISLNAVSLVNLVVSVGIGVEFVSHIVRAYTKCSGTHMERASESLTKTGSSVLSGITLTKFAGIIVLAFAKSQVIFKLLFFLQVNFFFKFVFF